MTINPHLPAGPYQMLVTASIGEHQGSRHVYVIDGSGRKIASIWGKQDEKLAVADLLIGASEVVLSKAAPAATSCRDCARPYGDEHGFPDLVLPDRIWALISPSGDSGGLLCPSCICKRLHDAGISSVGAFTSGPVTSISQNALREVRANR